MTQSTHNDRILVTGSGGRLGGLLRKARHFAPHMADRFVFQSRQAGSDLKWGPADSYAALPKCDTVVALWGATSGTDEALDNNVALVDLTARVATASQARRVFHLSSAGIYGPGRNMNETAPPNPGNAYALSKLKMERAVSALEADDDCHHCCLRLANVVGADSLAPALKGDRPLKLDRFHTGGGPVRSYIGASDFLQVLYGLSFIDPKLLPDVLNVASPLPVEMEALARASGCAIEWVTAPAQAVHTVTMDVARLSALLPDHVFTTDAVALVADWQRLEASE